jgi:glycerol-3-phosphate dehydrogenase
LPPRSLHQPGESGVPAVSREVARQLWAYSDAQITFPERLVIDLLADARTIAQQNGTEFRVLTYSRATLRGTTVEIGPSDARPGPAQTIEPAVIINATGAWVDATLARLPVSSRRLMGGTKGSHFVTYQRRLIELLAGQGVYTEARDGRPVFLLPFGEGTLVGTTDIPFEGNPAAAVASEAELEYLLSVVADVFPDAGLRRADITMHQCGVRPLPYVDAKTPAAITRRHQLVWNDESPVPLVSLVGGKLTTCRSLAEETAAALLGRLDMPLTATSRERVIPPTEVDHALAAPGASSRAFSTDLVRAAIQSEWASRLEDIVERRLMLHFSPHLSHPVLAAIAAELVQQGKLATADVRASIDRCVARLRSHFGVTPTPDS